MTDRNLVILLTGPGVSALATIRLVGPGVKRFLAEHITRAVTPGRIVHGELRDANGVIDDPVVVFDASERFADITLHGGPWVVQAAMECAIAAGFVRVAVEGAPPDLFPDAVDALDAELQLALPLARTERAVSVLIEQPALWRAWIGTHPTAQDIDSVLADHSLHHLLHPPSVAIVGLPNAGKSTLANQLFGTQRSIVSPVAGTTRDWVGEEANLDGLIVTLIDTPGRHDTSDSIERQAITQSDAPIAAATLVVLLLDATQPLATQQPLLDAFPNAIRAVNKIDEVADVEVNRQLAAFQLNARDGVGLDALVNAIHARLLPQTRPAGSPRWFTARQRALLAEALRDRGRLRTVIDASLSEPT